MAVGDRYPSERSEHVDPATGVRYTQLTDHKGHSHPLYFTNPGWYAGGTRLVVSSDRHGETDLFGLELDSGELVQLTEGGLPPPPAETSFLFASLNPVRDELYFWRGPTLVALDLERCEERTLYRAPEGFLTNMTNVTADGRYVCTGLYQDLTDRFPVDLLHGYVGFDEYWEAHPRSLATRIDTDTGASDVVFEEDHWMGHLNTSPTQPHLATFCHEGPWERIDNRIWGLDLDSGEVWPIRQSETGEEVGHEYWYADGVHVGYHGRSQETGPFYGRVRHDDSDRFEVPFPKDSFHFHSNDESLVVGDGMPWRNPRLLLWRFDPDRGAYEAPRVLLTHRGSFHVQVVHPHPRLSPDGGSVLFTSDANGYGNVFLAELPDDVASLPDA